MKTFERISIAVVGGGNIGSTFAFQLSHAGHDVIVVARPNSERLEQLRRDRGIVKTTGERADVRVAAELDEEAAYDLVVVTTPAHRVDVLLPSLRRSRAARILFMFNIFDPERLRDAVGAERCAFGMPFVMAKLDADGKLDGTIFPRVKTLHSDAPSADLFEAAGIPSAVEPQMLLWLRCHVPLCVAMESIAATAQRRGGGASWNEALVVARGLRGGFAIVKALGYDLYPRAKAVAARLPTPVLAGTLFAMSRNASFRDVLATGAGECRALVDVLLAAGARVAPAWPAATEAVSAMKP